MKRIIGAILSGVCCIVVVMVVFAVKSIPKRLLRINEPGSELHYAVSIRDNRTASILIKKGADVNAEGHIYGFDGTPLCIAADRGYDDTAELLIKNGADVNKDNPLYFAAANGHVATAALLIAKGADPGKIVICHADVQPDLNYMKQILDCGVFLEFDDFGKEFQLDPRELGFAGGVFVADTERALALKQLIDAEYGDRLLIDNPRELFR